MQWGRHKLTHIWSGPATAYRVGILRKQVEQVTHLVVDAETTSTSRADPIRSREPGAGDLHCRAYGHRHTFACGFVCICMLSAALLQATANAAEVSQERGRTNDLATAIIRIAVVDADTWQPISGAAIRLCAGTTTQPLGPLGLPAIRTNDYGLAVFAFDESAPDDSVDPLPTDAVYDNCDSCISSLRYLARIGGVFVTHPDYSPAEVRFSGYPAQEPGTAPPTWPCCLRSHCRPEEIWAMAMAGCNVQLQVGHTYIDLSQMAPDSEWVAELPGMHPLISQSAFAGILAETSGTTCIGPCDRRFWRIDLYEIPLTPRPGPAGIIQVRLQQNARVPDPATAALAGVMTPPTSGPAGPSNPASGICLTVPGPVPIFPNPYLLEAEQDPLGIAVAKLTPEKAAQLWNLPESLANAVSYGSLTVVAVAPNSPAARAGIEPGYAFFSMSSTDNTQSGSSLQQQMFFESKAQYQETVASRSFQPNDEAVLWGFQFPPDYQYESNDDLGQYRKRQALQFGGPPSDSSSRFSMEPQRATEPAVSISAADTTDSPPGGSNAVVGGPANASTPSTSAPVEGLDRRRPSRTGTGPSVSSNKPTARHPIRRSATGSAPMARSPSAPSDNSGMSATVGSAGETPTAAQADRPDQWSSLPPISGRSAAETESDRGSYRSELLDWLSDELSTRNPPGVPIGRIADSNGQMDSWTDEEFAAEPVIDLGGVEMEFVLIPRGEFFRGSLDAEQGRDSDEGPGRNIRIVRPFWMGKYEVTQEQWVALMGHNPSSFKDADNPVDSVSWEAASDFCRRLSKRFRRPFRLPTEAEWEYACRAGAQTRYCYGDDPESAELAEYAWFFNNSQGRTHPVGQKNPNGYGLYDMHGNVLEWCLDRYDAHYYEVSPSISPTGPGYGARYVVRGGSWNSSWKNCRSAARHAYQPRFQNYRIGLRIILEME